MSVPVGRALRVVTAVAAAASLLGALGTARATPVLAARDTAAPLPRGSLSVGVFNPLRVGLRDGLELSTHPLLFFVAPNAMLRVAHIAAGGGGDARAERASFRLTGEYGLSIPTLAMRLSQGYLFPSWYHGEQRIGWIVVPRAGAVASFGDPAARVLTARIDLAIGLVLTRTDTTPLDTYAPLELLMAPATAGYRGRIGGSYDQGLGTRWRARVTANLYLHGAGELHAPFQLPFTSSPRLTTQLGVAADVAVGQTGDFRLTFGLAWWNYFQHAIDPVTFESHRSNDLFPTVDLIWSRR